MPEKVLVYSRFPKALMLPIGERLDLMDAAGKSPDDVFSAEQLSGGKAMITAGGTPLGADMMDMMPKLGAIVCYGTGYDGVDLAATAKRNITVGHSPGANAAAEDAPAKRHARPQGWRLRHRRDRPKDRRARCRLRDRGWLFQPQP